MAKKKETVKTDDLNTKNQFWSVILFSVSILILLFAVIEGSAGWLKIHIVLRGLFSVSVFAVPVILAIVSYMIAQNKNSGSISRIIIQGLILICIVSAVVQIIFTGEIDGDTLSYKIKTLYSNGKLLRGGGVVSGLLSIPLISFFGSTGAKIIITLLLFVLIMLISNMSIMQLFDFLLKPFRGFKNMLHNISEQGFSNYLFSFNCPDYEDDEDDEEEEPEEKEHKFPKLFDRLMQSVKAVNKNDDESDKVIEIINNAGEKPEWENPADKRSEDDNIIDIEIFDDTDDYKTEENLSNPPEPPARKPKRQTSAADKDKKKTADVDIDSLIEKSENKKTVKKDEIDNIIADSFLKNVNMKTSDTKYRFPSTDMLKSGTDNSKSSVSANEMKQTAERLVDTLNSFGVQTRVIGVSRGPTVTRYELQPSAGVKVSKIVSLSDDIALNLAAAGVRIEAPIPGKPAVGIEIPNKSKDTVSLKEMLESNEFKRSKSKLSFAVGRDIGGEPVIGDIAKMPHVIIAGSTGSGKSVCTNSIIMSILYKATPEEVRLVLIDPKIVEFKVYDGIPHLLVPVVTDPKKAAGALNWAVQEMLRRYQLFADNNVRDITGYNELAEETDGMEKIPKIVIAIDELADLMMASKDAVEDAICRLAQMARAAGMHLIIATQRPTVDIITGLIKANIPSRIALSVMSQTDSRTILDTGGADKLLGKGDMLYFPSGIPKPVRVQGCFCSTKEIETVVSYIKNQSEAEYSNEILDEIEKNIPVQKGSKNSDSSADSIPAGNDEMLIERAIDIVVEMGQASTSSLQRKLKLGYARAARIVDELEEMGVVGPSEGAKPRRVIMSKSQWAERKIRLKDGNDE